MKTKNKKIKYCSSCFKSQHMVFSFAYLANYELDTKEKSVVLDRLNALSKHPFLTVLGWQKNIGFEDIPLKIRKDVPKQFEQEIEPFDGKYSVVRLYPNNNPTPGRIIGKLVNKVFYMFYIDSKGELYKH